MEDQEDNAFYESSQGCRTCKDYPVASLGPNGRGVKAGREWTLTMIIVQKSHHEFIAIDD